MKKTIVIFLLLTLLLTQLLSCQNIDPVTKSESSETNAMEPNNNREEVFTNIADFSEVLSVMKSALFQLDIEDPAALFHLIGEEVPSNFKVKDLSFSSAVDLEKKQMLYALNGEIANKKIDTTCFIQEGLLTLVSPHLLSENYSFSFETSVFPKKTELFFSNPAKLQETLKAYGQTLTESIQKNLLSSESSDDTVIIEKYVLDPSGLAAVLTDLAEKFYSDTDLIEAILPLVDPPITKEEFLQMKPSKDQIMQTVRTSLEGIGIDGYLHLTFRKDNKQLQNVLLDLNLKTPDPAHFYVQITGLNSDSFSFDFKAQSSGFDDVVFTFSSNRSQTNGTEYYLFVDDGETKSDAQLTIKANEVLLLVNEDRLQQTEIKLSRGQNKITLSVGRKGIENFALDVILAYQKNSVSLTAQIPTGTSSVPIFSAKATIENKSLRIDVTSYGENQVADTVSVIFDISFKKGGITLTLSKLIVGPNSSVTVDFSAVGFRLTFIPNYKFPEIPAAKSLDQATEAELNGILEKFQTDNAELIHYFTNLFANNENPQIGNSAEDRFVTAVAF